LLSANKFLTESFDTANYGGVMLWNRYYDKRDRYGLRIKLMV
jgi:hypothetical protein